MSWFGETPKHLKNTDDLTSEEKAEQRKRDASEAQLGRQLAEKEIRDRKSDKDS